MIPINQKNMTFDNGDCYSACIASILETYLEDIPNFHLPEGSNFGNNVHDWCKTQLFVLVDIKHIEENILDDCIIIANGKSPRATENWHKHSIVWKAGKMLHDPHLSRKGLDGEPESYSIFVMKT